MTDINFSFGFTEMPLGKTGTIQRPMLTATMTYGQQSVGLKFLLDSGADMSMIPREIAEGILGIPVQTLPVESINSVGNQFQVAVAEVALTIEHRGIRETLQMPVQIPMNCPGYPVMPLLGREPLFHHFDVQFRMDYTTARGKFTLRKVVKQRDPENYRVGGRPLTKGKR